jgi:hypothetical protein
MAIRNRTYFWLAMSYLDKRYARANKQKKNLAENTDLLNKNIAEI